MRILKKTKKILFLFAMISFCSLKGQNISFEKTESFYPNSKVLQKDNIIWGYLNVPENWEDSESSTIKIAFSVLKSFSAESDANAVVFIQGGPGASGIQNIWSWSGHPLRKKNDIILFDLRGTGHSEPRLCPDLGKKLLEILAKNQSKEEDEKQKTTVALSCKQDLLNREIDIEAYHSLSIAKDLNALKTQLGYVDWNVYGVSYGTYIAQVYASNYPNDIKTLTLDSSIADISTYYSQNTSNYMSSLSRVFKKCENNEECNSIYPNLEEVYYKTIEDLEKSPITVSVDKDLIESEEFNYNSEDFKIAIQQALYNKQLIEVIPLLIYQFKDRNVDALGNLVTAFSSLLGLDYGVYYCVSCNETLPNNEIVAYQKDASQYKNLQGGVSFYKSDYEVCEKWNLNRQDSIKHHDLSKLAGLSSPVLIFSGEYDPITPASNGEKIAKKFKNVSTILGSTYGHVPGFTRIGNQAAETFINNPNQKPDLNAFKKANKIDFVKGVTINPGVSKIGNSINQFNLIFLSPLLIALGVMLAYIFAYLIKLIGKKYTTNPDKIVRIFIVLTSIVGITGLATLVFALTKIAGKNFFILAFGLPDNFTYVFTVLLFFIGLLIVTLLYFIIQIKKINDRSIVFSVLFSNILLLIYMMYWGIVPFSI